jgi:hypothetical protein
MGAAVLGHLRTVIGALALAALLPLGAQAQPSPERLKAAVASEKAASVETMQALARIETGSGHAPGLAQMASLLEARLRALGAQAGGRAGVIDSLGMPGMGFHAKQEWVDLNKVEPRLYLAVRMIVEATR